jgi:hypothetical protein
MAEIKKVEWTTGAMAKYGLMNLKPAKELVQDSPGFPQGAGQR